MRSKHDYIFSGVPLTTAVTASQVLNLKNMEGTYVQVWWSGTSTGVFKLQTSGDKDDRLDASSTLTHWTDYPNSAISASSAPDKNLAWNVSGAYFSFLRLVHSGAVGTSGSMTAQANVKGA